MQRVEARRRRRPRPAVLRDGVPARARDVRREQPLPLRLPRALAPRRALRGGGGGWGGDEALDLAPAEEAVGGLCAERGEGVRGAEEGGAEGGGGGGGGLEGREGAWGEGQGARGEEDEGDEGAEGGY